MTIVSFFYLVLFIVGVCTNYYENKDDDWFKEFFDVMLGLKVPSFLIILFEFFRFFYFFGDCMK